MNGTGNFSVAVALFVKGEMVFGLESRRQRRMEGFFSWESDRLSYLTAREFSMVEWEAIVRDGSFVGR